MAALVLKQWLVKDSPVDEDGNCIIISGRQGGFIAWFLSWVGIDPTTVIKVSSKRVEFKASSLSGTTNRMIPLPGVCSTYYGYYKPWKPALVIFAVVIFLYGNAIGTSVGKMIFGTLISAALSLAYYFLNRTLTFGFVENSGVTSGIQFKRSVIENIDVNEQQARTACELTQAIIEKNLQVRT